MLGRRRGIEIGEVVRVLVKQVDNLAVRVGGARGFGLSTLVHLLNKFFPFLCEGFQVIEIRSELFVDNRVRGINEVTLCVPSSDQAAWTHSTLSPRMDNEVVVFWPSTNRSIWAIMEHAEPHEHIKE